MNTSTSHSVIKFCYVYTHEGSQKEHYLRVLEMMVDSILSRSTTQKSGKDLVSIYCDKRSDVSASEVRDVVKPAMVCGFHLKAMMFTNTQLPLSRCLPWESSGET